MKKEIWFDMDGTIADLYGVEKWLEYLMDENVYPYVKAKAMVNFSLLARTLNALQKKGWKIGIISWTSKNGTDKYNAAVAEAKQMWLKKRLASVKWDDIRIVKYGTNKFETCGGGILFDDEEGNRNIWGEGAYEPQYMMSVLKGLA